MFSYKQIENILNDMFYAHTSDMCSMYTEVIYVLCTQVIFERCSEKKEDKILLDKTTTIKTIFASKDYKFFLAFCYSSLPIKPKITSKRFNEDLQSVI